MSLLLVPELTFMQENMAATSGQRLNQQEQEELPLAPDGGWGWVVCAGSWDTRL